MTSSTSPLHAPSAPQNPRTPSSASSSNSSRHTNAFTQDTTASLDWQRRAVPEEVAASHPSPLYRVPVLAPRVVGRQKELVLLWQRLLTGKHIQVIHGVDGVGKSTLAAEFCDRARRSSRFSCVMWCQGRHSLTSQLHKLCEDLRGRKETDVLLVIDDVADVTKVISLLPQHPQLYAVVTTPHCSEDLLVAAQEYDRVALLSLGVLSLSEATELRCHHEQREEVEAVLSYCENVPLLVQMAIPLMEQGMLSPSHLLAVLEKSDAKADGALSVSKALAVLVNEAASAMNQSIKDARKYLRCLACMHTGDISDAVIEGVVGSATAASFSQMATRLGIFSLKWESSAYCMHQTTSDVLCRDASERDVMEAAALVAKLWPRRWRKMQEHDAYPLVWHSYTLLRHCQSKRLALSTDLMHALDRSALFLAHYARQDLPIAAEMWHSVFSFVREDRLKRGAGGVHNHADTLDDRDAIRIGRECGRLLHFLRDDRALSVLSETYKWSHAVHGERSVECSLVLCCLAPYLSASLDVLRQLEDGVAALENALHASSGSGGGAEAPVLSVEETRMLRESAFVLLLRKGQVLKELQQEVPESLWNKLEQLDSLLTEKKP